METAVSFRPVTDVWILARPKVAYYGAYPNGFLERANTLLGITNTSEVLHVCGGKVRYYPNSRCLGENHYTLDMDEELKPDFIQNAMDPLPRGGSWDAILIDPPYTESDAEHYAPGKDSFPSPTRLLGNALRAVRPGGRVGILHYVWAAPSPRDLGRPLALIAVVAGYNNRMRAFSVFERPA
jgi:hypothetical protein